MSFNLTSMENHVKWAGLEKIKNFGYANGWNNTPKEVKCCRDLGHTLEGRKIGNCVHEHYCPICKITWTVDSSG